MACEVGRVPAPGGRVAAAVALLVPLARARAGEVTKVSLGAAIDSAATLGIDVLGDVRRDAEIAAALDEVAGGPGKAIPQIALNWLLQRPSVANVIIGARNEEQLRQNLGAVGWNLTAEQVARLDAASATTLAYPYWHQRGFGERNPPPV